MNLKAEGNGFAVGKIVVARTENQTPVAYRLMCKKDGSLVLQGAYQWLEGWDKSGINWRDIPTMLEEDGDR